MSSERERILKAYSAMKILGISTDTVKPVLKKLFKLYDKNWELIEEDNYRTLADAIFEHEDDKLKSEKKPDAIDKDNKSPSRKPHGGGLDDEVSSTGENGKSILDPTEPGLPRNSSGMKMVEVESSQSFSAALTSKPRQYGSEAPTGSKCVDLVPVNSCHDEENSYNPHASRAITPKKERIDASRQFAIPTLHIHPGSNITSERSSDTRKKEIGPSSAINTQTISQTTYDIASSACGLVKISLTCQHTVWQHNFRFPSPNEILSFARQFCNKDDSQFSLINLLNEFCESYLEMGSDSAKRSRLNRSSGSCTRRPSRSNEVSILKDHHLEGHQGKMASKSKKRVNREISDITNGTEKVKISLLDETGKEDFPRYIYSPESITFESAYVHVSLARISEYECCLDCNGDCLSSSIPCACARETGGEFGYTPDGLLSERFVSSCISVKHSEEKQPLFYCQDCPLERAKNGDTQERCKGHRFRKFIKECWRKCGCNMRCGNRVVQRGITRKLQLGFFTKRKVDALEELTWDYEIDFQDKSHPVKAFKCLCGSVHCRDRRAGNCLSLC